MNTHDLKMKAHDLHQLIIMLPHFGELKVEKIAVPSATIEELHKQSSELMSALLALSSPEYVGCGPNAEALRWARTVLQHKDAATAHEIIAAEELVRLGISLDSSKGE